MAYLGRRRQQSKVRQGTIQKEPLLPSLHAHYMMSSQSAPNLLHNSSRLQPAKLPAATPVVLPEVMGTAQRTLNTNRSLPSLPQNRIRHAADPVGVLPCVSSFKRTSVHLAPLQAIIKSFPKERPTQGVQMHLGGLPTAGEDGSAFSHPTPSSGSSRQRPSLLEVASLSDLEASAAELNLVGTAALAFALITRCGSLEKAWNRFDITSSGKLSRWQWDTALSSLHIDTNRLCGEPVGKIFSDLAQGAEVTLESWMSMFRPHIEDPAIAKAMNEAAKQFESRCQERQKASLNTKHERSNQLRSAGSKKLLQMSYAEVLEAETKMSKEELAEKELQAAAERSQLSDELARLGLKGDTALAYILTAKFGSVQKAFHWFNFNRSGRIAAFEFQTGFQVLRVNLEQLTGVEPKTFFNRIAQGQVIRKIDWNNFFNAVIEKAGDGFAEALRQAAFSDEHGSLAERARHKKDKLRKEGYASKDGDGLLDNNSSKPGKLISLGDLSEEERTFREHVLSVLSELAFGNSAEFCSMDIPNFDSRKVAIIEDVATGLGMFSHILKSNACQESDAVMVFNVGDFPEQVRKDLRALQPHSSHEFPTSLKSIQRQIVHLLAADLGYITMSEGNGESRHVIAFNVGDFAEKVRRDLQSLKPGESKIFQADLTVAQRKMVHMIANELNLQSYSEGTGSERHIEVFNLASFADGVRSGLEQLENGEHKIFADELSRQQRKIVHCIAEELNISHVSDGAGASRHVVAANLSEFQTWVRDELEKLPTGETKQFDATFSVVQRKVVHEIAMEFGMKSESEGVGAERFVSVTNLSNSQGDGFNRTLNRRSFISLKEGFETDDDTENESDEDILDRFFDSYATANYKDEQVFSRVDLSKLADDLHEMMPTQSKKRLFVALNSCYDTTMQLQLDFGTRTKKGMTLRWFQVFIQKASAKVGRTAMGLMMACLDAFD